MPAAVPDELASMIRHDGAVVVPADVAGEVLRALVRDLTTQVRADGGHVSPAGRRVLWALHEAAQRHDEAPLGAEHGTRDAAPGTVDVTVDEAAERLECSPEYVRRLARTGKVTGRRIGRVWLIDADSVEQYAKGETAA